MANIFEREAMDIKGFIERNGYSVKQGPDHLVVLDPVQCSRDSQNKFNEVKIRDWHEAVKFVEDRS